MKESKLFDNLDKIVKIEPAINYFSISWKIHNRCNFDCMYCPAKWHDNYSTMKTLDQLQNTWLKVFAKSSKLNLPYKIYFSGGEVTINKNFKPFIAWLRKNYKNRLYGVGVTSNGSASDKYYLSLFKQLDWLSFSTHTEHMNMYKFFDTAKKLSDFARKENKSFHVNIMNEYWAEDKIKEFKENCTKNQINYSINEINYNHKTRDYPIFKNKQSTNV